MQLFNKHYALAGASILLAVSAGTLWPVLSAAQEANVATALPASDGAIATAAADGKKNDAGEAKKRKKFEYQLTDRPDPFYPFIAKEDKEKAKGDEIVDEETKEPLTGMRLFEPGQLRLVAVMGVQGKKIAMAEDMAGKGYTLSETMPIGKHGQIVRIEDGQVFIKETLRTKAGREITNDIIMTLKKEEDKK
jgi:Tfp pilus assembly protein PilP